MGLRYIGSKSRISRDIAALLGAPSARENRFVDAFCGTGIVAAAAAGAGWDVLVNDHLYSSAILADAKLASLESALFTPFGSYEGAIKLLNGADDQPGFITREYSPNSIRTAGIERRYFTSENSIRIDSIRAQIAAWERAGLLNLREKHLLLADLIEAASRVANIAGTYGCFLQKWTPTALRPLELTPRQLRESPACSVEVSVGDVREISFNDLDVVYLDPPYTKRQYASYYHIQETIAFGDEPTVTGVAGLRPWRHLASEYCYKRRALAAVHELIAEVPARRILLSYSNDGHISRSDLERVLQEIGDLTVHTLGRIGRYRPNQSASEGSAEVLEYVFEVIKQPAGKTV